MMFVQTWGEVFTNTLQGIWAGVANFLPNLIIAIIIFAIGWILATLLEKIVESIFKSLKIDSGLKSAGFDDVMKRTGHSLNSGLFVGSLIKWFVIVVFLVAAFDTLHLAQVNQFLQNVVLMYLPKVIVAVLILMVAVMVADAMQKIVTASARAAHVKSAHLLGVVARWSIWIFAVIMALYQLQIAQGLINTIVMGVIAGGALAFGLAFGLGGRDFAAGVIEKTAQKLEEKA